MTPGETETVIVSAITGALIELQEESVPSIQEIIEAASRKPTPTGELTENEDEPLLSREDSIISAQDSVPSTQATEHLSDPEEQPAAIVPGIRSETAEDTETAVPVMCTV